MDNKVLLSINVAARKAVATPLEFLDECLESFVRGYPPDEQEHARRRFMTCAYEALETKTRDWRPPEPAPWEKRMGDEEALAFEQQKLMFGKHAGRRVMDIDVQYLSWLADSDFELKRDLRRYLRRK